MPSLLDDLTSGLVPTEVDIQQFAESSEYCNKALFPRQAVLLKLMFLEEMTGPEEDILTDWIESSQNGGEVTISPNIRERRDYLRERGYKHFREIQLVGGRRSSKGFMTGIAMAKVMWDTLQLGDPHERYGIDKGKEIYFSCVAASESQAKEFQYGDFVSTVETCKAFEPYLQKSLETEFRVATPTDLRRISAQRARSGKIERDTSKLRGKALAANAGTLRGSATMVIAMDEMAHMTVGESKASASEVYGAAIPSLSQFGISGMIFCNSSPYTKVGKFYEIFEVAMRPFDPHREVALSSVGTSGVSEDGEVDMSVNGDPRLFSFEYPSWELFKGYRKYKSKWKPRERGRELGKMPTASPDWDPEEVDADGYPVFSEEDKEFIVSQRNTENADPEVFKVEQRGQFAEVVDSFLIPGMVDRMYRGIPRGVDYDSEGNRIPIYDPLYTNFGNGALNTNRYKFHLDPSSTTAGFGFAIAHTENIVNPLTGEDEEHCVFDLIKRWDPKNFPGKVIRWKPILDEVALYADIFRPYEITFDQHQSAEPIQTLQDKLNARNIQCAVYEKVAPQPLDAKVLTPHGWATMGEIGEGMSVIGSDGLPHRVSGVFPKGEREVYRVTFSDGSSTECTEDHIWRVTSHGERGVEQTLTLREIVDRGLTYGNGIQKWKVKHIDPVQYEQWDPNPLPVDPYLLGSLLGDGCFHKSVWLATDQQDADEQEQLLAPLLPDGMSITRRDRDYGKGAWTTLYFKRPKGRLINPLSEKIRELGLWYVAGKDKFIPEKYLRASVEDRVALLQGLIDTDGHVGATSYHLSFTTCSPSLAYGVADLVGSLGGSATIRKNKGRSTIIVRIKRLPEDIVPCRLERKRTRYHPKQRSGRYRHIKSVELVGIKETQCIRVDCDDHLYVTDDYILTHNTNEGNWKGWQVLKTAIYQGLVHAPFDEGNWNDPTSQNELKFLQEMPTGGKFPKVEKQAIGPVRTKDQADCVRECVHSLIGNLMANRARERLSISPAFGGQGGYSIGQSPGSAYSPGGTPVGISDYYSQRNQSLGARGERGSASFDRANLTRSAMGGRGKFRGGRSRGRGF